MENVSKGDLGGDKMQEFFELIGNQAFPIAISVYLLTRVNTELASLKDAINKLTATIESKK